MFESSHWRCFIFSRIKFLQISYIDRCPLLKHLIQESAEWSIWQKNIFSGVYLRGPKIRSTYFRVPLYVFTGLCLLSDSLEQGLIGGRGGDLTGKWKRVFPCWLVCLREHRRTQATLNKHMFHSWLSELDWINCGINFLMNNLPNWWKHKTAMMVSPLINFAPIRESHNVLLAQLLQSISENTFRASCHLIWIFGVAVYCIEITTI